MKRIGICMFIVGVLMPILFLLLDYNYSFKMPTIDKIFIFTYANYLILLGLGLVNIYNTTKGD